MKTKAEVEKYYTEVKNEIEELNKAKEKAIAEDRPRSEKAIQDIIDEHNIRIHELEWVLEK